MSDLGQRHEPERAPGRRAVDDDQVEASTRREGLDADQRRELVCPGQERELLSDDLVDPLMAEQVHEVGPDPAPVNLDHVPRVDLARL